MAAALRRAAARSSSWRTDLTAPSSDFREPRRDGRLTLVTPYDPESAFTMAKAMGRNKDIYALADYALVVRFKVREGGTWAGAIEQLSRNQVSPPGIPLGLRRRQPRGGA